MNTATRVQGVTKGPMYPLASFAMSKLGTPHYLVPPMGNAILEIYPPPLAPIPFERVYTYPYMPSLVIPRPPVTQVEVNSVMLFTQTLPVQNADEQKEQEKKRVEFMMQPKSNETQQKSKFD